MEDAWNLLNEFCTLQGMESKLNDSDDGILWDEWVNFTPHGSESNGGELVKGGMRTEGVDNTPRQCLGPTNGK